MLEYYVVLRSVLCSKPHLKICLTRCRHCRIFFISDPRNAKRKDLSCPFGCQDAHCKESSTRRSVEYYRSEVGKIKKKFQNEKRLGRSSEARKATEAVLEGTAVTASEPQERQRADGCEVEPGRFINWLLVEYLRMLTSLLEARKVTLEEMVEMLRRVLRQHSMARQLRIDHIVFLLHKLPP